MRAVFDAATDPAQAGLGVLEQRAGALERVRFALGDLAHARAELAVVEARMVAVLDALGLTELVTSVRGLSAARNAGLAHARGALVAFTDDDVTIDRHWLSSLAQVLLDDRDTACVTGLILPLELDTPAQLLFEQFGGFVHRGTFMVAANPRSNIGVEGVTA